MSISAYIDAALVWAFLSPRSGAYAFAAVFLIIIVGLLIAGPRKEAE